MTQIIVSHSRTTCHERITRNFPAAGFDHRGRRCRGISHRRGNGIGISTPAQAAKVSQQAAKYQDTPKGEQRCENCVQFEAPSTCKTVDGTVAAQGWCQVYAKKPA